VVRIRQVRKGEGVARRTEEEKEAAGGDAPDPGIVPPQDEVSEREGRQQADEFQWKVDVACGGDAGEPGGAEGDEGRCRTCGGGGGYAR